MKRTITVLRVDTYELRIDVEVTTSGIGKSPDVIMREAVELAKDGKQIGKARSLGRTFKALPHED